MQSRAGDRRNDTPLRLFLGAGYVCAIFDVKARETFALLDAFGLGGILGPILCRRNRDGKIFLYSWNIPA